MFRCILLIHKSFIHEFVSNFNYPGEPQDIAHALNKIIIAFWETVGALIEKAEDIQPGLE